MLLSHCVKYALVLIAAALLGGCTTYVTKVNKDEAYNKRIVEMSVVWVPRVDIKTRVTRAAQGFKPTISEKEKSAAQQAGGELLVLFGKFAPESMGKALAAERVTVVPGNALTSTQLRLQPLFVDSDCAPLGCQHSLWVEVSLFDKPFNKVVWSASFKVGAPFPTANDESVIHNFTASVIRELQGSRLL